MEMLQDRFAGGPSFRGGRGGFAPRGGFAGRGGFVGRGGFAGPPPPGRGGRYFTNDLYADYNGPEGVVGAPTGPSASLAPAVALEPSKQIMIRNVSRSKGDSFKPKTALVLIRIFRIIHCSVTVVDLK